ncbi:MAG: polysaccharide biosynthesis protein [Lentimicrobiaceae bacterium]|jgi:FlaA1/EpsC-like NDP-sugar epimerase|nr:polysaccharide biosynthesis protein [Lentimicrobiaceae bacterium]
MKKQNKGLINAIKQRFFNRFLPIWAVLLFDITSVFLLFYFTVLLLHNFGDVEFDKIKILFWALLASTVYLISFLIFKPYSGILRHTEIKDTIKIFMATTCSFIILLIIVAINDFLLKSPDWILQLSIIIIHYVTTLSFLTTSRLLIKIIHYYFLIKESEIKCNTLIFGAGSSGLIALKALQQNKKNQFKVVAFLDDNKEKVGKKFQDIPILFPREALNEKYIKKHKIEQVIIAIEKLSLTRKQKFIDKALLLGLQIKIVPPIENWINNELTATQLHEIKIEDLLGRDQIKLNNEIIAQEIENSVVMVTGAAGSIGSEIARQIVGYNPAKVILLDQAESPLYELQLDLQNKKKYKLVSDRIVCVVANIKDKTRMEALFCLYKPQLIYHAAAYKHVPLMENYPYEALKVNVFGTKTLVDLSLKYNVKKFIMISTDKAVNPTSVMGASKRIAEIYAQSRNNETTRFITTRFGNVLGSNGSVIPIFKKQIASGGPVTITHKDITRFFMTIPEACNLVLEAGTMGKDNEIFIFDMGSPVRIYDLAEKMIRLSGLEPNKDIQIIETGLRPGEKLYEELLTETEKENMLPTYHPKIMRAKTQKHDINAISNLFLELHEALVSCDETRIVAKMKEIVSEYISNNSSFCSLDK